MFGGLLLEPSRLLAAGSDAVRGAASLALKAAPTPARVVDAAALVTRQGLSVVERVRREVGPAASTLTDLRPNRANRRVWAGHGHAQIEVRGMTGSGPRHRRVGGRRDPAAAASCAACGGPRSTRSPARCWWPSTSGRVDVATLLDTVRGVEAGAGHPRGGLLVVAARPPGRPRTDRGGERGTGRRLPGRGDGGRSAGSLRLPPAPPRGAGRPGAARDRAAAAQAAEAPDRTGRHRCRAGADRGRHPGAVPGPLACRRSTRCTGSNCSPRRCPGGRCGTGARTSCAAPPGRRPTRRRSGRRGRCRAPTARSRRGPSASGRARSARPAAVLALTRDPGRAADSDPGRRAEGGPSRPGGVCRDGRARARPARASSR